MPHVISMTVPAPTHAQPSPTVLSPGTELSAGTEHASTDQFPKLKKLLERKNKSRTCAEAADD